ncbi:TRAP-type C4-dicarboxylate transport system, small permease component [Spirosomataceae bacterium TFI 002]|nr:TRAP-type C4-dicarboxylate transport system, small permease component [Spirosomataceae bacterium TFI 002]
MTRFLKYGTIISTYLLVASVLLQIYARFFMDNTPAWTEEASRLFFIYTMSFAAGLALKNNYYVYLELFYDNMNLRSQKVLMVLIYVGIVLLFTLMSYASFKFVQLGIPEKSPSMKISMSIAFFSMFIMAASICFFAIIDILKIFKDLK